MGGTDFTAHTWAEHMARQSSHSGGKTDAGAGRWEKKKKRSALKQDSKSYLLIYVHSTHSQQPAKCLSMDEQTDKMQSTQKME